MDKSKEQSVRSVRSRKGSDRFAGKVSGGGRSARSKRLKGKSYVTLPFGVRVVRKNWYLGLGTLFLALCLFGGLICLSIYQYSGQVAERVALMPAQDADTFGLNIVDEEIDQEFTADTSEPESNPDVISLESILEKYRAVSGLAETQGAILRGAYVEDDRAFDLKLMVKAPNLVRKILTDDGFSLVCNFDGTRTSVEVKGSDGEVHEQALTDLVHEQAIKLEGAVLALADDRLPDVLVYQWESGREYKGRECWTVRRRVSTQESMIHLVDVETGYELVRFVTFMHDGEAQELSLHLSDHRASGAGVLPHAYTLKLNGVIRGQVQIESIKLDPGLMPWMFSSK